ncbi:cysteine-rich secretory protein family domain-containing protein [Ditylenchus destructor]|nr:cysteine-rich secretory protein family domain-containing protein [Ditylenchus destructor]
MLVLNTIAIVPVIALSSSERQIAVDTHNQYRSQLAKGQVQNRGAELLPSGSNIYKLSYSNTLEQAAQAWADNCEFKHSVNQLQQTGQGQNLYEIDTQQDASSALTSAADMWWNEVVEVGINSDLIIRSSMFGDENNQIGHFTAMAWGDTTQIGCGVSYCASQGFTLLVCNYYKGGNVIGRPIYEIGSQCQSASDCTTYSGSNCDSSMGLCIAADGDTTADFGDSKDSSRLGNNDISQGSMNSVEYSQEGSSGKSANDADDESFSKSSSCDDHESCAAWKLNGFCDNPFYPEDVIKQHCPSTCGMCDRV